MLLVEDGTPGGIRRAVDYLMMGFEHRRVEGATSPEFERVHLRGAGSLRGAAPVYARALLSVAVRAIRPSTRPRLVHLNLTQRGSTWRALGVVALARTARVPVVLHLHSSGYDAFTASLPAPGLALVRWMFARASRVLVLGRSWAAYAERELRVPAGRLAVVPNAVPASHAPPRARASGGTTCLLFLGQVGERKGAGDLIEALAAPGLARLDWRAKFVGDGDIPAYRRRASDAGIGNRVEFTGWVEQAEAYRQLDEADVLVLPSHAEGMPMSVLEGLAHGLAVVATPVGAVGEVIEDGISGLLTPPGDVAALARALGRLIEDPDLRSRLETMGRARWERDHTVEAYAARIAAVYDAVAPADDVDGR